MSISENLRELRIKKNLTQEQLSKLVGLRLGQISKIERGESAPRADTIYKLMKALDCSANELLMNQEMISSGSELIMAIEKGERLPEEYKRIVIKIIDSFYKADSVEKIARGETSHN